MQSSVSHSFIVFVVFAWSSTTCIIQRVQAGDDESTPSWKSGVSEWNGSGYELPDPVRQSPVRPSPIRPFPVRPAADAPTGSGGLPYTKPIDPNQAVSDFVGPAYGLPLNDPPSGDAPLSYAPPSVNAASGMPTLGEDVASSAAPPWLGDVPVIPSLDAAELNLPTDASDAGLATSPNITSYSGVPSYADLPTTPELTSVDPVGLGVVQPNASPELEAALPEPSVTPDETIPEPTADKLFSAQAGEAPPLEEEVVRWYQYPQRWIRGWDSHAEFGIDGSDGNAVTLALQTGLEMKRKSERSTLAVDIDYRKATNRNATVEDNGRFNLDYDYLFADSPWSGFGKYGMEWDRFKAFDLRLNVNGGIGYFWIRDDRTTFVTRFGAGASKEIGAPVDDWIPEAVAGLEAERQLTSRQKVKGKVDYFPAWEDFDDFRLVTDLSWEILLDGTDNLSLKLAATDRYDSTPQGAEPNDIYYSMLLLYKF